MSFASNSFTSDPIVPVRNFSPSVFTISPTVRWPSQRPTISCAVGFSTSTPSGNRSSGFCRMSSTSTGLWRRGGAWPCQEDYSSAFFCWLRCGKLHGVEHGPKQFAFELQRRNRLPPAGSRVRQRSMDEPQGEIRVARCLDQRPRKIPQVGRFTHG